jgi:hypothetical protein
MVATISAFSNQAATTPRFNAEEPANPVPGRSGGAIGAYRAAGSPAQHEFLLTIGDGRQTVSHPDIDQTWDLPVAAVARDVG